MIVTVVTVVSLSVCAGWQQFSQSSRHSRRSLDRVAAPYHQLWSVGWLLWWQCEYWRQLAVHHFYVAWLQVKMGGQVMGKYCCNKNFGFEGANSQISSTNIIGPKSDYWAKKQNRKQDRNSVRWCASLNRSLYWLIRWTWIILLEFWVDRIDWISHCWKFYDVID